jgi:hypothetical protein
MKPGSPEELCRSCTEVRIPQHLPARCRRLSLYPDQYAGWRKVWLRYGCVVLLAGIAACGTLLKLWQLWPAAMAEKRPAQIAGPRAAGLDLHAEYLRGIAPEYRELVIIAEAGRRDDVIDRMVLPRIGMIAAEHDLANAHLRG